MKALVWGNIPSKAYETDLGYDLVSAKTVTIKPQEIVIVPTGTRISFPPQIGAIVKDRSSFASRGLFVHGGVIDPGYTGEIHVVIYNASAQTQTIQKGERIAQLLFFPVIDVQLEDVSKSGLSTEEIERLFNAKDRNTKGFGSSGK